MNAPMIPGMRPPNKSKGKKKAPNPKHGEAMVRARDKNLADRQEQAEVRAEILERLGL